MSGIFEFCLFTGFADELFDQHTMEEDHSIRKSKRNMAEGNVFTGVCLFMGCAFGGKGCAFRGKLVCLGREGGLPWEGGST